MRKSRTIKSSTYNEKIRKLIDAVILDTHDHHLNYLPENIGLISSFLLKRLFSKIIFEVDSEIVKKISKDDIVVYTTKYKSYFEYLFYYTRLKQEGLRLPEIGFNYKPFLFQPVSRIFRTIVAGVDHYIRYKSKPCPYASGYFEKELKDGRTGLLSLINKKGLPVRFIKPGKDTIRYLIEVQESTDRQIFIVPLIFFFSKEPRRSEPSLKDILFGSNENPGLRRRLYILYNHPEKIFSEISEPVNLKKFLALPEILELSTLHKALALRRHLLSRINRHRQSVTGPDIKKRVELKEDILTENQLQKYIEHHAKKRKIPNEQIQREAAAYFDEIAANYKVPLIKIGVVVVRWILDMMFDGISVNQEDFNRVKNMSKKGPLILVPCHKSHIDYLIVSYFFYINNMPVPHIVAGKNLSFWPFGTLFRSIGAFFIRRTFSGAVLYSKVFSAYVEKLLEEGFNIELFFEGTRSRTGKLIKPQLGFLTILLNAYKKDVCDDMIFVPIYIGYDRVIEEGSYLHEVEGGEKEAESLTQVIKARKLLKNRYGKIYLNFHEPIALKEYLIEKDAKLLEMTSKQRNVICRDIGNRIANAINKVSIVTPNALVASAVLNRPQETFSYNSLISHIQTYMTHLISQNAQLADTLFDPTYAVNQVLHSYISSKYIDYFHTENRNRLSDATFRVNESGRANLEYYKNNCIIFFVPAAFTSLSILEKDAFLFSAFDLHAGYAFLSGFFKNEFIYDTKRTSDYFIRKNIKAFIDEAIVTPHSTLPDTYHLTSSGLRKLKLFSSFLKTYFESYWVALNFLGRHPKNSVSAKDRLKKMQSIGERMYKRKEIDRKEALSKINYKNAEVFFLQNGVRGLEDKEKINFYTNEIKKYLNILSS